MRKSKPKSVQYGTNGFIFLMGLERYQTLNESTASDDQNKCRVLREELRAVRGILEKRSSEFNQKESEVRDYLERLEEKDFKIKKLEREKEDLENQTYFLKKKLSYYEEEEERRKKKEEEMSKDLD